MASNQGPAIALILFRIEMDDPEGDIVLPGRYEVCSRCEGRGETVDPRMSVWTEEDRRRDPDGFEDMMAGHYNITCPTCKGDRVVLAPVLENADPHQLARYARHKKAMAELARDERSERFMEMM